MAERSSISFDSLDLREILPNNSDHAGVGIGVERKGNAGNGHFFVQQFMCVEDSFPTILLRRS